MTLSSRELAAWLRAIPQSRHEPLPLDQLPHSELVGQGLAQMLAAWGAVEFSDAGLRATSQPAYYFLHSLAAWLETETPIIPDWSETQGVQPHAGLRHGTTLVYMLEQERQQRFPEASPIRFTAVAEILVVKAGEPPQFLVQWDARAGQYQLIGGRQKEDRGWREPIQQTAIRELEEELEGQVHAQAGDFTLDFLAEVPGGRRLSPSFGALTQYHFTFFHARELPPIQLSPDDRWVTRAELLAGHTHDGQPLRGNHIRPLEARLGHTIDALPSSFR